MVDWTPAFVGGGAAVVGAFVKPFCDLIYRLARKDKAEESSSPTPPPQVPTYFPQEAWRDFCTEQFTDIRLFLHRIDKEVAVQAQVQKEILSNLKETADKIDKLELDHQTICKRGRN